MPANITNTRIRNYYYRMLIWLPLLLAAGCRTIKNYPVEKPFIYKTTVKVDTKLPSSEKSNLVSQLENQLDDSLQVKWTSKRFRKILNRPPVFDTIYAAKSLDYINDLLRASGFMYGNISWDSSINLVENQQRVNVVFNVVTGKRLRLDSIGYAFRDSTLQAIALASRRESQLKKGDAYSNGSISLELDRLLNIYRNNGYLKINREDVYAEVDTVVAALIDPGLDPFEQIRLLEEVQKRRENPQIDIVFKQRGTENPEHLQQYRFREIRIFPDRTLVQDGAGQTPDTIRKNGISIISTKNLFKTPFLLRNNFLLPGALYKQEDVSRTNNVLGQMGAWQQVGIDLLPVDSLAVVDAEINMFPAKKQNLTVDLEASRNATDLITTSNLFGLAINFGLHDRNVNRQAIQANTNMRFGIELGNRGRIIQTLQGSIGQSFSIPKFVTPFRVKAEKNLLSTRTLITASGTLTDLRDFLTFRSLNTTIGYEWTNKKNRNWYYSPFNIEYVRTIKTDSFYKEAQKIPNLNYLYNDGLIISQYLILRQFWTRGKRLYNFKIQLEESGGIFGNIKTLDLNTRLYRFAKADIDFRHYINNPRSSWAFRFFVGVGIPYGKQYDTAGNIIKENNLPFFKSYFAGGPSSMRAWQVRQLGPGSSKFYANSQSFRFADLQLETNIEYRFNLGTLFGINLKSALFTDIGNIWYRNNQGNPELDEAAFKLSRLYKDIAVAGGTSLRFDFNYFMIRFDWAYKMKDPFYSDISSGWFQNVKLLKGQFQLGINAPF
ncbi:BamA/TamA family outer membrane protein [Flavihumibacter stibioxidans]|nr:BamA/TamA family outer membrane protein [Flavihumibacter stibioxidans]